MNVGRLSPNGRATRPAWERGDIITAVGPTPRQNTRRGSIAPSGLAAKPGTRSAEGDARRQGVDPVVRSMGWLFTARTVHQAGARVLAGISMAASRANDNAGQCGKRQTGLHRQQDA